MKTSSKVVTVRRTQYFCVFRPTKQRHILQDVFVNGVNISNYLDNSVWNMLESRLKLSSLADFI